MGGVHDLRLTGLVLAGGRSRRMGRDKALLEVDGRRMIDRAAATLASFCAEVLIASGTRRRVPDVPWPQIADPVPDAGPLAGILAGLERARTPLVAVLAVDAPYPSAAVFRLLAGVWEAEGRSSAGAVPVAGSRPQPLHAVYATSATAALRALFDAGERSPAVALERLGALYVPPDRWRAADPDGRFAVNWNRPSDVTSGGTTG